MAAIGIDTHKWTLAACAVDAVGSVIDERTFDCTQPGFVELAAWAGGVAPEVRFGIEGSASYGAPVAHPSHRRRVRRPRGPTAPEPARTSSQPAARQERPG